MAMHQDWAGHDLHGLPNGEQTCQRKIPKNRPVSRRKTKASNNHINFKKCEEARAVLQQEC